MRPTQIQSPEPSWNEPCAAPGVAPKQNEACWGSGRGGELGWESCVALSPTVDRCTSQLWEFSAPCRNPAHHSPSQDQKLVSWLQWGGVHTSEGVDQASVSPPPGSPSRSISLVEFRRDPTPFPSLLSLSPPHPHCLGWPGARAWAGGGERGQVWIGQLHFCLLRGNPDRHLCGA